MAAFTHILYKSLFTVILLFDAIQSELLIALHLKLTSCFVCAY